MASAAINNTVNVVVTIDTDATSGITVTIPRAMTVIDVITQANATSGSGSVTLSPDITSGAQTMATNLAIVRAAEIDDALATLAAGDTITFTTNGAADRGQVTLVCVPAGEALTVA